MAGMNYGASQLENDTAGSPMAKPYSTSTEPTEWLRAHEALSRLAKARAGADAEEGRWLLAALRATVHVHLGFGSFAEYVERLFGYKPRSTQEKLRVAEALESLPLIAQALEAGSFNWSCARELSRVAVAETEREWLEAARGQTVHQLEALVAGKAPGDKPSSPSRSSAQRHVLRFEVAPETLALFREAMSELRRKCGGPLDDDSALMLMARHVLGGPGDDGRASYQVALSLCPQCGRGELQASGEQVPVGAEVVAMAACDGQHLGRLDTPVASEGATADESVIANDGAHTGAPAKEVSGSHLGAHTGGPSRLEGFHHAAPARAKQTIAPAVRRAVLRRDHQRCTVPGCRNVLFLDLHHLELRSDGGGNHADNLITLCGAHHRAAHCGKLKVSGCVSTGVRFEHADGSDYGQVARPRVAETQAKAFAALRGLGFREREVRRALAELSRGSAGREPEPEPDLDRVLRGALARLAASHATS